MSYDEAMDVIERVKQASDDLDPDSFESGEEALGAYCATLTADPDLPDALSTVKNCIEPSGYTLFVLHSLHACVLALSIVKEGPCPR